MPYIGRKSYNFEKSVLYNNVITERLYGASVRPENIAKIAGYRVILAGSWLANGERLLPRGTVISPYSSGGGQIIVANPYVFKVGDILRAIGTPTSTPNQEYDAVRSGTAPAFGTVTGVDATANVQVTTVTPGSVAVGNVFTVTVEGVPVTYVAQTTSTADVTAGLAQAFSASKGTTLNVQDIRATDNGTNVQFTQIDPGEIFVVTGSVAQGSATTVGTLDVTVTTPVGAVQIVPQGGNSNLPIGSKIGTITDIPLGVISHDHYLTTPDGIDHDVDLAVYNKAPVFTKALRYLDGHIVQSLPGLSFIPIYGS